MQNMQTHAKCSMQNFAKCTKLSKMCKIVQNLQKLCKMCKITQNLQYFAKCAKLCKLIPNPIIEFPLYLELENK